MTTTCYFPLLFHSSHLGQLPAWAAWGVLQPGSVEASELTHKDILPGAPLLGKGNFITLLESKELRKEIKNNKYKQRVRFCRQEPLKHNEFCGSGLLISWDSLGNERL